MAASPTRARRYDSSGRRAQAQANRERILHAADGLFRSQGYAGTSLADIATAAGVSTPTVYAAFKSKANLLKEAVDVAIVGDTEQVALHDRPTMRHVHEARTADEVLRRFAAVVCEVAVRACPIYAVAYAVADAEPEIAALVTDLDRQRLTGATYIATAVADRLGITDQTRRDDIRDSIWTLNSPHIYHHLVEQRGWSAEKYRGWITSGLIALATASSARQHGGDEAGDSVQDG